MSKHRELAGMRFGRLVATEYVGGSRWRCVCDCGNEVVVRTSCLTGGNTKSCGCFRRDFSRENATTHGKSKTRLYHVWASMHGRCENPNNNSYRYYGQRGISVCEEWNDFASFMEWALENGYDEGAKRGQCTLDRIDSDKDYSPDNCRWVDSEEQANNERSNVIVTYRGKEYTLARLAKKFGLKIPTLWCRIHSGWSIEDAVETPLGQRVRCFKPYRAVELIDQDGNVLASYDGVKVAAAETGCSAGGIGRVCGGTQKSVNGMLFKYANEDAPPYNPTTAPRKVVKDGTKCIKVDMCDNDGNVLATFDSIVDAAQHIGAKCGGHISSCCKGKLKTAYGYVWKYSDVA